MISYVIGKSFISIVINNEQFHVTSKHKNYELIKTKLKDDNVSDNELKSLINEKKAIEVKIVEENVTDLTIEGSVIKYKGQTVHNSIVSQIIETKNQGYKFDNLLKFLENLLQNTSYSVVKELYDWISSSKNISITADGAFLAYKKVRSDYLDIYSGTMDNSVGKVVEMERNKVDDKRENTCSSGLHFCSYDYLNEYGGCSNNKVVIVKIFPQDVVSIPVDYNYQKGRCSKYEVVGEVDRWKDGQLLTKTVDDYEETKVEEEIINLEESYVDEDFDQMTEDELEGEEEIIELTQDMLVMEDIELADELVFDDIIKNLNTPKMTKIYNDFYGKSVKKLRTLTDAILAMRKIYDKDYHKFAELANKHIE